MIQVATPEETAWFSRRHGGLRTSRRDPGGSRGPAPVFGRSAKLWLRSDLGITIGTGVSAWADQSGGGWVYSQGTGANQPTFNASDINGKPSVQFDGVNDLLTSALTTGIATPSSGFFIWTVMRNDVGTAAVVNSYDNKALWSDDPSGSYIELAFGNDKMVAGLWAPGDSSARPNDSTATWAQAYYRYDGATIAASWNKGAETTSASTYGAVSHATQMGANYAGAAFFAGRIAELIIVSRNASASEIAAIQAYGTARYGV